MNDIKKISNPEYFLDFFVDRKYSLYRHLLLMLFVGMMIFGSRIGLIDPMAIYVKIGVFFILLSLFYSNMYWLVPRFLFNGRYGAYASVVIFYIGISNLLNYLAIDRLEPYLKTHNVESRESTSLFSVTFIVGILIGASAAIKLFQRSITDTRRINELERITKQSELEQLKNQINPHFLFNMLNNANVLIHKDPEKASQVLMKLSDLLRYQLYDSARSKVLLTADIHFLTDFLNLEKIRRDNFDFIVSKEGEISGVQIPPFLFIIFVENAVKHNMDAEKQSYVHLYFSVKNGELYFVCNNSKPTRVSVRNVTGGLGLSNVKRTLELLYPDRHDLVIKNETSTYSVRLTIKL